MESAGTASTVPLEVDVLAGIALARGAIAVGLDPITFAIVVHLGTLLARKANLHHVTPPFKERGDSPWGETCRP